MATKEYFTLAKSFTTTAAAGPFTTVQPGYPIESPLGNHDRAAVYVQVTAISGAGATFTPIVEEYDEFSGNWVTAATGTGLTAVGTYRVLVDPLYATMYRLNWTLTGTTPSVTVQAGAWCSSSSGT